jgi:hypothetical protein
VVDRDDAEVGEAIDGNGRLVKSRVDAVDWDGVVRVRGVARDVADDGEFAR